jgi:hypothetical protein
MPTPPPPPPPPTTTILQQEPYYKDRMMIQNDTTTIQSDATNKLSEDKQRPATTFEEVFRDVQPHPDLETTLMAWHRELQVRAERGSRAQQEEEQADFSCAGITHARNGDGDVAILDEGITTSRSGNCIQNSSKSDYFYSLVATPPQITLKTLQAAFGLQSI